MQFIKLGENGRLSIPCPVLQRIGIEKETSMLVDTTPDGAIILRPATAFPLEIYNQERVKEFLEADKLTPTQKRKIHKALKA